MRSHIAMALKDPADLDLWQKTLGARGYGGEDASQLDTPDDTYTQDRMVQMGRIVVLEDDTPARLLSVVNNVAQVEITDGVNKGITGMVSKYCLYRGGSGDTQIYKMQFYHSPESPQRPDGSFAPMAGIDYPADANHPPGSINHEIVPDRHSPTP